MRNIDQLMFFFSGCDRILFALSHLNRNIVPHLAVWRPLRNRSLQPSWSCLSKTTSIFFPRWFGYNLCSKHSQVYQYLTEKRTLLYFLNYSHFFKYAGRRKFGWTITKNITLLQCRWLELCRSESKLHFLLTRSIFRVLNRA